MSPDRDLMVTMALIILGGGLWASNHTALSAGILATGLVLAVWRPTGAFWAVCAAIPLVFRPVAVGGSAFSLLELGIVAAFLGVGFRCVVERRAGGPQEWLMTEPRLVAWLGGAALAVFGALSLIWLPEPGHRDVALRNLRWVIIEPLMLFVVARRAIHDRGARPVVFAVTVPAAVASGGALIEVATGDGFESDGIARAMGPYLHPNNLALYLERIFVFFGGMLLLRGLAATYGNLLLFGAIGLGMAATFSRGMVPAVATGLILIGWMVDNRRVILTAIAGFAGGLGIVALAASERLGGDSVEGIIGERRHVWKAAASIVTDYPVSGIGLDQFLVHHAPRYIAPEAWSERYISHPHNIVLDSWLSLGAPGVVLLLGMIVGLAVLVLSARATPDRGSPVRMASVAAIATGLVHGLVDNGYFLPDLAALTWILIAMVTVESKTSAEYPNDAPEVAEFLQ